MIKYFLAANITAVMVLTGLFYWYYNSSQTRIQVLSNNNSVLSTAVEANEQTIKEMQENAQLMNSTLTELNTVLAYTRDQNNRLQRHLSEHDIGELAGSRPVLVENIINQATDDVLRCFELITGAPLTTAEINAVTPEEFNNECPDLWHKHN